MAETQPVLSQNQSSHADQKVSQGSVMFKQMSGPLQSADVRAGAPRMHYFRTSNLNNPGPGDYETEESKINLQKKSPRATIGKEKRFLDKNEQMTVTYQDPITL